MTKKNHTFYEMFKKTISSNWFFSFVIVFFILQTTWIASSAIYPMLFDEEFHLGVIDIYSKQTSPFINTQPPEAVFHGDITRYGSYMFHYLMSFPYSVINSFTNDIQTTIILIRLICILFVSVGLFVFRAFLLRAGLTKPLTHISIATFTMIPIVPFAFAQINYDSLAFLLTATIFYLSTRSIEKDNKQVFWIIMLLSVSALSSLVKFTILPIAFANVLFVSVVLLKQHNKNILKTLIKQLKNLPKLTITISLLFLTFSTALFIERYVVNIIKYRALEPKCDIIHSEESCVKYTVWRRDNTWRKENIESNKKRNDPLVYTYKSWVPGIYSGLTGVAAFTYDNPNQKIQIRYLPSSIDWSPGTIIMRFASWLFLAISIVILLFTWKKLPHKKFRYLAISTLLIFAVSMWLRNYSDYMYIGTVTGNQGRYYLPLLIPVIAVVGISFRYVFKKPGYKMLFLALCLLIFSQGGGFTNYILFSKQSWYWANNRQLITNINKSARNLIEPLIIR